MSVELETETKIERKGDQKGAKICQKETGHKWNRGKRDDTENIWNPGFDRAQGCAEPISPNYSGIILFYTTAQSTGHKAWSKT